MKARKTRPDAKRHLFIEADTYVIWSNLAIWLQRVEADKPLYLGSATQLNNTAFAHGGSGYVLNNKAIALFNKHEISATARLPEVCCGDFLVGAELSKQECPIMHSWPHINGLTDDHECFQYATIPVSAAFRTLSGVGISKNQRTAKRTDPHRTWKRFGNGPISTHVRNLSGATA
jgi:hypothetical protein